MKKYFILLSFFLTGCFINKKEFVLPGKIAVKFDDTYFIYNNSYISDFKFSPKDDNRIHFGGFTWINNDDRLIGGEYIQSPTLGTTKGNVVCIDLLGNIVQRIYESKDGEITGTPYLSKNNKLLLFTTENLRDDKIDPIGFNSKKSIVILDFNNREVIKRIENIGISSTFELYESPWLYDEDHFIYSIASGRNIVVDGNQIKTNQLDQPGVYSFDVNTNQKKLLMPEARLAICSPVSPHISYIKDQTIWVMNIKDSTTTILYKGASDEKISNIHWTPDGNYLYIVYFINHSHDSFSSGEKLIEVSTGKEIPFKKIGHGFYPYTWK